MELISLTIRSRSGCGMPDTPADGDLNGHGEVDSGDNHSASRRSPPEQHVRPMIVKEIPSGQSTWVLAMRRDSSRLTLDRAYHAVHPTAGRGTTQNRAHMLTPLVARAAAVQHLLHNELDIETIDVAVIVQVQTQASVQDHSTERGCG